MNIEEVEEPKKYENYHAQPVSDPFKSIAEHRKVRESPRKMDVEEVEEPEPTKIHMQNPPTPIAATPKVRELPQKMNIEEAEEPKKYENYHAQPVSDPFKSIAEHRKVRESPRKMNIEEVEEPETTKIHMQNPPTPIAATPEARCTSKHESTLSLDP